MRFRAQLANGLAFQVTRSARELTRAAGLAESETYNAEDRARSTTADGIPENVPLSPTSPAWRFANDHYRMLVSGAHPAGECIVTSETAAQSLGGGKFLHDYHEMTNKFSAFGVTRPILHGYPQQAPGMPWPGRTDVGLSESWNCDTYPEWQHMHRLADYWRRHSALLEPGAPRCDLALLRDGFLPTEAGPGPDYYAPLSILQSVEQVGYRFGYIDSDGIIDCDATTSGTLFPKTTRYRAVVIEQTRLPTEVAEPLLAGVHNGLRVVFIGTPPSRGGGYVHPVAEDRRVAAAVRALLASPRVRKIPALVTPPLPPAGPPDGITNILDGNKNKTHPWMSKASLAAHLVVSNNLVKALHDLGVVPDAHGLTPVQVFSQPRSRAAEVFPLWNGGATPVEVDGSFAARGVPSLIDLWSGAPDTRLDYQVTPGGRTRLKIRIEPGRTAVVVFDKAATQAAHITSALAPDARVVDHAQGAELQSTRRTANALSVGWSDGAQSRVDLAATPSPLTLRRWHLDVSAVGPNGDTKTSLDLKALTSWLKVPEIAKTSGLGGYTTTVTVPAAWLSSAHGVRLSPSTAYGSTQVKVSGVLASPSVIPLVDTDVTHLLKVGANTITVDLRTPLSNALLDHGRGDYPPAAAFGGASVPQEYGLIGPVVLTPYSKALARRGVTATTAASA